MFSAQRQAMDDLSTLEALIVQAVRALSVRDLNALDHLEQQLRSLIGGKNGQIAFFELCRIGKFFGRYGRRKWAFGEMDSHRLSEPETGILNMLSAHQTEQPERALGIACWFCCNRAVQCEVSELARKFARRLTRNDLDLPLRNMECQQQPVKTAMPLVGC